MAQGFSRADQPIRELRKVPRPPAPPADPAQLALLPGIGSPADGSVRAQVVGTTLPRARAKDRPESHEATKRAARGITHKQRAVLGLFLQFGPMHDEALVDLYAEQRTAQLARGFGPILPDLTDSSIRTRRSELVTLEYLQDAARKATTKRGGPASVWQVTAKGLVAPAPDTLSSRATGPTHDNAGK